jgi:hypothetical protein
MWYTLDLGKDYALCLELPGERIRAWKDGVTFWTWTCDLDLFKEDHKPSFTLRLEALNRTLFGVEIYNVHHLSPEDEAAFRSRLE